ncbi:MAG TPA: trypsin-like peptidase domain-containing protein [Gammaproteobacteria bacterium]|nr:trypsin-like peptidase domain-containing protein [Gammaproteobacteria bacterium]
MKTAAIKSFRQCRWALLCLLAFSVGATAASLPDFAAVAAQAAPSVVKINAEPVGFGPGPMPLRPPPQTGDSEETTLGSGLVISADGYILTCAHVIAGAGSIEVTLADGHRYDAKVVGADRDSDLALLKVAATHLPTAKIGDAAALKPGQWVAAIGAPFGLETSVTVGVVSAVGRHLASEKYVSFIQSDVPINPGSSGGPLLNLDGEVVGINSEIYSRTGEYTGVSFAVPINLALNVVRQLRADGVVNRGWLGVSLRQVTPTLAQATGMAMPVGALVTQIVHESPAAESELRVGDIITHFNGEHVMAPDDLPPLVAAATIGEPASLGVLRDGEHKQLNVTIGKLEHETDDFMLAADASRIDRLGVAVRDLSPEQRRRLHLSHGVLVQFAAGAARGVGIVPGDVILRVARQRATSAQQIAELEKHFKPGELVPVLVLHDDDTRFVALEVPPAS